MDDAANERTAPDRSKVAGLLQNVRANLRSARFNRHELAGSLGDLGTFLPLLIGMAAANGLDFASGMFFAGLFNVVTGLLFPLPVAVQPMKAIAAVALTEGLTPPQIVAAGAMVSAVVLIVGVTGLIDRLARWIPQSAIRGMQLALGMSLLIKAVQMVASRSAFGGDSVATGVAAAVVVILLLPSRRAPAALVLFAAGVALVIWKSPGLTATLAPTLWSPSWSLPALGDFATALPKAALPQIPLTILNSVVSVCALSVDLFPRTPLTPRKVAVSVGAMNLVGVWFGAMPMCHGAGGLSGQYRFGARTNGAILLLGGCKMSLALLFGASLTPLCAAFPTSILGVMLAISGIQLASVAFDQKSPADIFAMLATAGACLGLNNVALGLCVGLGAVAVTSARGSGGADQSPKHKRAGV